jgi:hexulose-6-phosphate isomerase
MKLGIMQGRLLPPEAGRFQSFPSLDWRDEFSRAAAAGLDTIEWIYDAYGEECNPIATDSGLQEMHRLSKLHGVTVESVCADWFMDFPLLRSDGDEMRLRWERLVWLMYRCARHGGVNRIVIPFVDASEIRSQADVAAVANGINAISSLIDETNAELHLETALSPQDFAELLARIPHPRVKVNYDSGNSASLGFVPRAEFDAYGSRVGSVHIKDRLRGGGTVPLGSGDTDFEGLFEALERVRYSGDFILQAARGSPGDELEWARNNVRTARTMLRRLEVPT